MSTQIWHKCGTPLDSIGRKGRVRQYFRFGGLQIYGRTEEDQKYQLSILHELENVASNISGGYNTTHTFMKYTLPSKSTWTSGKMPGAAIEV